MKNTFAVCLTIYLLFKLVQNVTLLYFLRFYRDYVNNAGSNELIGKIMTG